MTGIIIVVAASGNPWLKRTKFKIQIAARDLFVPLPKTQSYPGVSDFVLFFPYLSIFF
jgi:hypothetical protein